MRTHPTADAPPPALAGASATQAARRVAGAAGLTYVGAVAIENMELLTAPRLGSRVAAIRAGYADEAFAAVTTTAGAFGLLAYCAFAAALFAVVARAWPWAVLGLVGGIGGPAVAAAGLVAASVLVAGGGGGLSDDVVRALFEIAQRARIVSALFVALFLAGFGLAAARTRALPPWLAAFAFVLAIPMAFAPVAAFTGGEPARIAVVSAFAMQSLWIFTVSLWLLLGDAGFGVVFVRRAAFLVLVLAAGLVGLAMLAVPDSTARYFAWGLQPAGLAAFAGGVYVGSAVVYAVAIPRPEREVRPLVAGAVVLSVSVFVFTMVHLDVFDLDRLQAWAWIVLFAGFSAIMIWLLVVSGGVPGDGDGGGGGPPLVPWARAVCGAMGALLAVVSLALWLNPVGLTDASPFALSALGGRFAGAWIALLATVLGWAAWDGGARMARLPALALVALPAGALVAGLRTLGDLDAPLLYVAVLAVLAALGGAVYRAAGQR